MRGIIELHEIETNRPEKKQERQEERQEEQFAKIESTHPISIAPPSNLMPSNTRNNMTFCISLSVRTKRYCAPSQFLLSTDDRKFICGSECGFPSGFSVCG